MLGKKTNIDPEKLPKPNRKGSSSNHHFSGAMLNADGVSQLPHFNGSSHLPNQLKSTKQASRVGHVTIPTPENHEEHFKEYGGFTI